MAWREAVPCDHDSMVLEIVADSLIIDFALNAGGAQDFGITNS